MTISHGGGRGELIRSRRGGQTTIAMEGGEGGVGRIVRVVGDAGVVIIINEIILFLLNYLPPQIIHRKVVPPSHPAPVHAVIGRLLDLLDLANLPVLAPVVDTSTRVIRHMSPVLTYRWRGGDASCARAMRRELRFGGVAADPKNQGHRLTFC